ncbi:MAG: SNF2-related protein [candidate division WOR-3 bacterium]
MGRDFGKTWWGKAWVHALEHLGRHYANRLPRGRSYARAGNVLSVNVLTNGLIVASVQGTRRTPYKVRIALRSLSPQEVEALAYRVRQSPFMLAELLSGKLPEGLGPLILPSREEEFETNCSCPDWANPCKHIASVLYVMAEEIDKDPFILFRVRGIDPESFKRAVGSQNEAPIAQRIPADSVKEPYRMRNDISGLDLSLPEETSHKIAALLTSVPETLPKTTGDRFMKILLEAKRGLPDEPALLHKWQGIEVAFRIDGERIVPVFHRGNLRSVSGFPRGLYSAWVHLQSLPQDPSLTDSLRFASVLSRFAASLVDSWHMIPRTVRLKDLLWIEWVPLIVGKAEGLFVELSRACPLGMFPLAKPKNPKQYCTPEEGIRLFLTGVITKHIAKTAPRSEGFLSSREPLAIRGIKEEGSAAALENWLGAFALLRPGSPRLLFSLEPGARNSWEMSLSVRTERGALPLRNALSEDTLRALHYISGFFPGVKELVDKGKLRLSQAQTLDLITKTAPFIELAGGKLLLPKSFIRMSEVAIKRKAKAKAVITKFLDLQDIVDFKWTVSVGESEMSLEEFESLVRDKLGLVRIRDEWVLVEPGELSRFMHKAERAKEALSAPASLVAGEEVERDRGVVEFLEKLRKPEDFPVPNGLKTELRPYQIRGFRWLVNNLILGACPCIADDMGLGKTVQVISALLYLRQSKRINGPALVVCPASLMHNWEKEIKRFAPSLTCQIYHGGNRRIRRNTAVVITTYGMVREDATLRKMAWSVVIADEAQNIKNPQAQQTKSLKSLNSDLRIAMTGTPIENSLQDLWSIMDFLVPGYLGSWGSFYEKLAKPIQKYGDSSKRELLRKAISPLVLRRLKTDPGIAPDLPEKIEKDYYCPLTPEQASLYQAVVDDGLRAIKGAGGMKRKNSILNLIVKLKKICNHPRHFDSFADPDPSRSGKTKALLPLIREIVSARESVLLFTQFKEMALLLRDMIEAELGISPLLLHGGVNVPKRQDLVRSFQEGAVPVAIFTLKTGGVGLNLERASHVIHFDLWWNPATESQATDRAHRIGQTRRVMVHRLMTRGTLEEKINELLLRKKGLAEDILAHGETYFTELSDDELRDILGLSA